MKINFKGILFFFLFQFFFPKNFIVAMEIGPAKSSDLIDSLINDWEKKLRINGWEFKRDEELFSEEIKNLTPSNMPKEFVDSFKKSMNMFRISLLEKILIHQRSISFGCIVNYRYSIFCSRMIGKISNRLRHDIIC